MEQIWQKLAKMAQIGQKAGAEGRFLHFQVCMYK
jgi:hypothetical protein